MMFVFLFYHIYLTLQKHQVVIINNTVKSIDLICGLKGVDPIDLLIEFQCKIMTTL